MDIWYKKPYATKLRVDEFIPILSPLEKPMELCCVDELHPHLLGAKRIVPGWLGTGAKLGAKEAPGDAEGGWGPSGGFCLIFVGQPRFSGTAGGNSRDDPHGVCGKIPSEKNWIAEFSWFTEKIPWEISMKISWYCLSSWYLFGRKRSCLKRF